jgi:hypothetical protein
VAAGAAGFAAGGVNAIAGGGTLLSFPVLIALGLPPVSAIITNTVALSPGYLGGVLAQRTGLVGQRQRVRRLTPVAIAGGLVGSILLVLTSDDALKALIPILLLVATALLAAQDRIRAVLRIDERAAAAADAHPSGAIRDPAWVVVPVFVVSIYGGYFGAGLGIMLLAVLGIVLHDTLTRLNAIKQVFAFAINMTAALFFLTSGEVYWVVALVMSVTSLAGGALGGRLAGSVSPRRLRTMVVIIGTVATVAYAVKYWT